MKGGALLCHAGSPGQERISELQSSFGGTFVAFRRPQGELLLLAWPSQSAACLDLRGPRRLRGEKAAEVSDQTLETSSAARSIRTKSAWWCWLDAPWICFALLA